jgi:hypothetical protein
MTHIIELIESKGADLFQKNSYSMFNLVKYLLILFGNLNMNTEMTIETVCNVSNSISEANKSVKDLVDYPGRIRVKKLNLKLFVFEFFVILLLKTKRLKF